MAERNSSDHGTPKLFRFRLYNSVFFFETGIGRFSDDYKLASYH